MTGRSDTGPIDDEQRRTFGQNLRAERSRRGWSQDDLAQRLGAGRATVGHWENGERRMFFGDVVRVCEALDVPLSTLLHGDGLDEVRKVLGV